MTVASSSYRPEVSDPLDHRTLVKLREEASQGDEDFFPTYLDHFAHDLADAARGLSAAAKERNAQQLIEITHRLRGAAGNFGAYPLIELCLRVEKPAKAGRLKKALLLLPALRLELRRVRKALRQLHAG